VLSTILAVVLPILLFLGVCVSYVFYLISGSETRTDSAGDFGGYKDPYRRDTEH
jgi:hypothetical protein